MQRFTLVLLTVCALTLVLPSAASAVCTANKTCSGTGCFLGLECPSPPYSQPWWISCSAPDQHLSCTGQYSCLVGSNYVECDGVRSYCWGPDWCYQGTDYLRCGTTSASCSNCQTYGGCHI